MPTVKQKYATCHPLLPHAAKGLCRNCYARQQMANWKIKNREKYKTQEYYRHLRSRYGIDKPAFKKLWESQNGCCALCGVIGYDVFDKENSMKFSLVVDHDHNSGKVRGLLCQRCNIALGGYEAVHDNPKLKVYLE